MTDGESQLPVFHFMGIIIWASVAVLSTFPFFLLLLSPSFDLEFDLEGQRSRSSKVLRHLPTWFALI